MSTAPKSTTAATVAAPAPAVPVVAAADAKAAPVTAPTPVATTVTASPPVLTATATAAATVAPASGAAAAAATTTTAATTSGAPNLDAATVDARQISDIELCAHKSETDGWLAVHGFVLDVTSFIASHPGGKPAIMEGLGTDATAMFEMMGHNSDAHELTKKYRIGRYAPKK